MLNKNLIANVRVLKFCGFVLVCGLFVLARFSTAFAVETLIVYENESIVLTLDFQFSEYALGSPSIADCVVRTNSDDSHEMIINGTSEGVTNLIFWDEGGGKRAEYSIHVKARNMNELLKEVRQIIRNAEGLRAEIMGKKIVIKGEALAPTDMVRVIKLIKDNPNVVNAAVLGPAALKVLARTINSFLGAESLVKVKPVGQTLVLHGISYGNGSAARIEKFASIYHSNVVNLINEKDISLEPRRDKMIQVHAHFLEVKKNALKAHGFQWIPFGSLGMEGSAGKSRTKVNSEINNTEFYAGEVSGFLSNLLPKFTNSRDRSMGRQLKVSSISVRSGEEAKFQSGGEVGFPVVTGTGAVSVQFKKYGMLLEILPIAHGEHITLKIKVRVNYPINLGAANAGAIAGYYNFTLSELETIQYCKAGNSIALAGLLENIDRKAFDAKPGHGGALFELFRSSEFQKEQSDLVIMITPEILGQAKDANIEIKQQVFESFDSYEPLSR